MLHESYITREMVSRAIKSMQAFHEAQIALHSQFGMDFLGNRGRRNIIMSASQEKFFADEIGRTYKDVIEDGRTGQADIYIGELARELECKMTSPMSSTGAIQLQTDFETLSQKGELDYLYVIAGPDFKTFCVLHFSDLTTADFRLPHATARGKVAMVKHKGMKKCAVLWGSVETQIERTVARLEAEKSEVDSLLGVEMRGIVSRKPALLAALAEDVHPETGEKLKARTRRGVREMLKRLEARPEYITNLALAKLESLDKKIATARLKDARYSFILEPGEE